MEYLNLINLVISSNYLLNAIDDVLEIALKHSGLQLIENSLDVVLVQELDAFLECKFFTHFNNLTQ